MEVKLTCLCTEILQGGADGLILNNVISSFISTYKHKGEKK